MNEKAANSEQNVAVEAPSKRKCSGTRKDGAPCGAWAVLGGELCAGHAGLGIGKDVQRYARAGALAKAETLRTRAEERKLSLLDRVGRELEARAQEIVAAYLNAGLGEKGDWRALEALVTRVHGRPVERLEVEAPRDPLDVASMSPEQRASLMAKVLDDHPGLRALVPRTPDVPPAKQAL